MTNSIEHCSALALFDVKEHQLMVNGKGAADIAQQYPNTALYLYDRKVIESKINLLRKHLPKQIQVSL